MQKFARIGSIAFHLPETVEDNDLFQSLFPKWDMELIYRKTGIWKGTSPLPGETPPTWRRGHREALRASTTSTATRSIFSSSATQSPDYPVPTTACLLQDRLRLPMSVGALDFNLGCSGYVYGLSLADGLIRSGAARGSC